MGKLLRFLVLACVVQVAGAQGLFKGFVPDENGTNLDDPQASKTAPSAGVTSATLIKDCAECPEMVVIPAGSFVMGSDKNADESPLRTVTIRSFLIGRTEVTQQHWFNVMGGNANDFANCWQCPVDKVYFHSAQEFINRLNHKTGQKYRLPSEAEWEYAARAGSTAEWSFGSDESKLGNYAWDSQNSMGKAQAVGQKLPNAFGLFDVHGNVYEWTQDCLHDNYVEAPTDGSAWTTGCSENRRVLRGGSWNDIPAILRSATRFSVFSINQYSNYVGFRLARDL